VFVIAAKTLPAPDWDKNNCWCCKPNHVVHGFVATT